MDDGVLLGSEYSSLFFFLLVPLLSIQCIVTILTYWSGTCVKFFGLVVALLMV
jgi:hypothetical protein